MQHQTKLLIDDLLGSFTSWRLWGERLHLRNHGFVRIPTGWRLSKAFDMNPNQDERQHALTWDGKTAQPDLEALKQTAPFYRITRPKDTQAIINEVTAVVATWRERAQALQIPSIEVQAMKGVFAV